MRLQRHLPDLPGLPPPVACPQCKRQTRDYGERRMEISVPMNEGIWGFCMRCWLYFPVKHS